MNVVKYPVIVLKRLVTLLSQPAVPFYILPVFALMLIAGTVSQRYIGLYESQKIFFGSVPALILLGLLTLSLACKFVFYSPWSRQRAGINVAHLGILVLLSGGFLTGLQASEGNMIIGEGETVSMVEDYHIRDLIIAPTGGTAQNIPFASLHAGQNIPLPGGARLEINALCRSCTITRQESPTDGARGMARFMQLNPGKPALQDEENITGITMTLRGAGAKQDGQYVLFDPLPKPLELTIVGQKTVLRINKRQSNLPFAITLHDFQASNHPGTAMARAYHSDITVHDNGIDWTARIEMNKPLRYKGYTFFQSSFIRPENTAQEFTVLAVVRNRAWLFPYIGTGLMAIGLLIQVFAGITRRRIAP